MEAIVLSTLPEQFPISSGGLETMLKAKLVVDEKYSDILSSSKSITTQISTIPEKNEEDGDLEDEVEEDFDINDVENFETLTSTLLMMTRTLRRSSFIYFYCIVFKEKNETFENFGL